MVLHVNWVRGSLRLWAESLSAFGATRGAAPDGRPPRPEPPRTSETSPEKAAAPIHGAPGEPAVHGFVVGAPELARSLVATDLLRADQIRESEPICLQVPADADGPQPSDRLAALVEAIDQPGATGLGWFEIPTVCLPNPTALGAVLRLEDRGPAAGHIEFGHSMGFWIALARFLIELLVDQRFIPTLFHPPGDGLRAAWRPWLHDEAAQARLRTLLTAMPPVVRAIGDGYTEEPWRILYEALTVLGDATVRSALIEEGFGEAIAGRDPTTDPHAAWLEGLLARRDEVRPAEGLAGAMLEEVRGWISQIEETGRDRSVRLCLALREPAGTGLETRPGAPGDMWRLTLNLQLEADPPVVVDAKRIWASSPSAQIVDGHRIERPQEFLLAELGRASRIYPELESALGAPHPTAVDLTTAEAARFLSEYRALLEESGFAVITPRWWGEPSSRLGLRLLIDSPPPDSGAPGGPGLARLVDCRWQVALGEHELSIEELRQLASENAPLLRLGGRWVEVSPGQMAQAAAMMEADSGRQMPLLEAIQMGQGLAPPPAGVDLPVLGVEATGWVKELLETNFAGQDPNARPLKQPDGFIGTMRPYQLTGLRWLIFLERHGLGGCLADDMGLGKTIQMIALLLAQRADDPAEGPTLLVVPTSLISNWTRELKRFAPSLRCHVHHGMQRTIGASFAATAAAHDIVITTYSLVPRDRDTLGKIAWRRVVLDEAQYIKNPPTKQTTAIRALNAPSRVALTGTPVENRLSELWSIMEFCNPGYLGGGGEFRRRWAVPIERHRDRSRAETLRTLVQPFVLRRLKTDPRVITDLPSCVQTKEYATLTAEQMGLYELIVSQLIGEVDRSDGIERRGRVLAALVKLKQVCNHPAQYRGDVGGGVGGVGGRVDGHPLSSRSGKCMRLIEMLEELLAAGDKALIFTQFRQMGHMLAAMIRHDLDSEVLFLHGSTPRAKRQEMIDRFQSTGGTIPIFILSLKAGGVGLNLTAANHVFHFDRWWNPAVENQASDRAFRIGQTRNVHVHKFVCVGTLEEQIDQMIERKIELSENVIGSGEQWLTEFSGRRLKDVLRLRQTAMELDP